MFRSTKDIVTFHEGLSIINPLIDKIIVNIENDVKKVLTTDELMRGYTTVHQMASQRLPHNYADKLIEIHTSIITNYCVFIKPFLNQDSARHYWTNFSKFNRYINKLFYYLNFYAEHCCLPRMLMSGNIIFKKVTKDILVSPTDESTPEYVSVYNEIKDACEGEQKTETLITNDDFYNS